MPSTKLPEIQLEVLENQIICHSPKFYLNTFLPYRVNEKEGKAKWISDKFVLEISVLLPILNSHPRSSILVQNSSQSFEVILFSSNASEFASN